MDEERPLARWSRLKRKNTQANTDEAVAPPLTEENALVASVADDASVEEVAPEDLPDPETLDKDSDFSVFLGDKVPEAIKRKAMSALWRSDPVLANLDGLNDYDEDFSLIETVGEVIKTAYQAGKGYVEDDVSETDAADASTDDKDAEDAVADPATNAEKADDEGDAAEKNKTPNDNKVST